MDVAIECNNWQVFLALNFSNSNNISMTFEIIFKYNIESHQILKVVETFKLKK